MEIETNGNCFNIYSEKGCTTSEGRLIRYQAGRLLTELSKFNKHRWDGDLHVDDEHVQVKSVGPCFDKCDPRNWQGDSPSRPVTVTIYEDEDFTGTYFFFAQKFSTETVFVLICMCIRM